MKRAMLTAVLVGALTQHVLGQPAPATTPPQGASADDLSKAADAAADVANLPQSPEDLSKAADAAADMANVPPPPAKASSADIDLSSLGLDPSASSFDDKLNIYGFADISYQGQYWLREPIITAKTARTFSVGTLALYLAKNLTAKARALAEVQFTFLPNGAQSNDGTFVDTTARDPTNYSRPVRWGGVVVHRVYVEYDLTEGLTIRAGHWLTPYGIWNIDHGSPAIIGTSRPYIIGQEFFPEHQTGLELIGSRHLDNYKLSAHLTATNGRGPAEAQIDADNKLAFGGRVEVETPWGVKAGGSYYRGRYTGFPPMPGMAAPTYREEAYGGDLQFDHDGLRAQAEISVLDRHLPTGDVDFGFYVLAGYRFNVLWNVMPFGYYEDYRPGDATGGFETVTAVNVGLNFRPTGSMVLKLQGTHVAFSDGEGLLAGNTVYLYVAQAAWAF
jgi:hypothetical protein